MSYEAWRISFQSSEQAARAAWEESARLREENSALRNSLKAANANAERFEREWYLRGDVLEEAMAWAELERVRELPEGWIGKARALLTPNACVAGPPPPARR